MTQEQLPISEIVNSKWYVEIKDRITGFCKFIESESALTGSTYLIKLREHLELLYQAGGNLDWVDLKSNVDFDLFIDDKEYRKLLNIHGVWEAKISAYNSNRDEWIPKARPSTFFPTHWTNEQLVLKIQEAFKTKTCINKTKYIGITSCNIEVVFILKDQKIRSIYPLYTNTQQVL